MPANAATSCEALGAVGAGHQGAEHQDWCPANRLAQNKGRAKQAEERLEELQADRTPHRRCVRTVGLEGDGMAALRLNGADDLGRPFGGSLLGDGDVRVPVGECQSDGRADAAAGQFAHSSIFL